MTAAGEGRRLVLLRHGRTAWNLAGRAQGHADTDLDETGHAQAVAAATSLAALAPAQLWSSDLARARQTASYVERATGLAAKADARLREYDVGARQGMDLDEFAVAFPAEHRQWLAGDGLPQVPGAESTDDVLDRMLPALREALGALAPGETGIVVTHGAALKVALLGLLGWPQELSTGLEGVHNCHWVEVRELAAGERLRLAAYNRRPS